MERKRHLGNDVVLIIFRERGNNTPFNPKVIRSQFNRTYSFSFSILTHPTLNVYPILGAATIPTVWANVTHDSITRYICRIWGGSHVFNIRETLLSYRDRMQGRCNALRSRPAQSTSSSGKCFMSTVALIKAYVIFLLAREEWNSFLLPYMYTIVKIDSTPFLPIPSQ